MRVIVRDETKRRRRRRSAPGPQKYPREANADVTLSHGCRDLDLSNRPHQDQASARVELEIDHQRVPSGHGDRSGARSARALQGLVPSDYQTPPLHSHSDRSLRESQECGGLR